MMYNIFRLYLEVHMAAHTPFGDYIRAERDRSSMGLREASRALGISPSYLSRLEAGEFPPPSGLVLRKIAQIYGLDIKLLLDKAGKRQHEMMAADVGAAPALQAFYRLAYDQPPEMQERMLEGAIGALDLPEEQKRKLMAQLRAALSRAHGADLPRRASGDDGLFDFDIAPRILSLLKIRALAKSVLRKVFGSELPIPIPVETIIRKFDSNILLVVHNEIEGGRDGERRELLIHNDLFEADDNASRRRANFTMAHEFCHCIEHLPLVQQRHSRRALARKVASVSLAPQLLSQPWFNRKRGPRKLLTREDWREWQANQFAAELLMPAESVVASFEELHGVSSLVAAGCPVEQLADETARASAAGFLGDATTLVERFDTNPQSMAIRLISLGLVCKG
jgi:transcriptional regulator with XRE-family HTH domain